MIFKQTFILGLTASFLAIGSTNAQTITRSIDEFNTVHPTTANSTSCTNILGIDPLQQPCLVTDINFQTANSVETGLDTTVWGGTRNINLSWDGSRSADTLSFAEVNPTTLDDNNGTFNFQNDPLSFSSVSVTWPGESNGLGSLGEYDIFVMRLVGTDLPGVIGITVNSTQNTSATLSREILISGSGDDYEFRFADFSGDLSAFSSIKAIILTINPALNDLGNPIDDLDVTIDFFRALGLESDPIPEPSLILGLAIAGGIGVLSAKRGQKAK